MDMQTLKTKATPSPFHRGEKDIQERLGVRDIETWARRIVRPALPDQHQEFYGKLPFLVIAARDSQGRPWATILEGEEGFASAPDDYRLIINATPAPGDALDGALVPGSDLGILGIELATRRRNRVNGRIADQGEGTLLFKVDQSFGNCPQYIREREWVRVDHNVPGAAQRSAALSADQMAHIRNADTFFIATGFREDGENPAFGTDASHRGGDAGFVEVLDATRIRFPDYAGNNHFNTVGNILVDPRAGFLFVDFTTGGLLQLTGRASIDDDPETLAGHPGAKRLISLEIDEVVEVAQAVSLRWDADAGSVRSLKVVDKIIESDDVTSFLFAARDGGALPDFEAGQHLPIELGVMGLAEPIRRTYSLSNGPGSETYRITVKREELGLMSRLLHDQVEPGLILESRSPAGDFVLPAGDTPLVLISAGVGVTPMVSMLHAALDANPERPVFFLHGARDGQHHPLAAEVAERDSAHAPLQTRIAYSQPGPSDQLGRDFDQAGRITAEDVLSLAGAESAKADFMICGPEGFMTGIQEGLEAAGIDPARIHWESFGPRG